MYMQVLVQAFPPVSGYFKFFRGNVLGTGFQDLFMEAGGGAVGSLNGPSLFIFQWQPVNTTAPYTHQWFEGASFHHTNTCLKLIICLKFGKVMVNL